MDAEATRPIFDADRPHPLCDVRSRPAARLLVALGTAAITWPPWLARRIAGWPRHGDAADLSDHQLADIGLARHDVERPKHRSAQLHPWLR